MSVKTSKCQFISQNGKKIEKNGVPVGTWNKYESRNPLQQLLIRRFEKSLVRIMMPYVSEITSGLDFGCGQGRTTHLIHQSGVPGMNGCDISDDILAVARKAYPDMEFVLCEEAYATGAKERYDLVSMIEVLEHLEEPATELKRVLSLTRRYALISVPDEPLFRTLNFCAGKYVRHFGNSPGHIQHWNKGSLTELLKPYLRILQVKKSLPWIIVFGEVKS